MASAHLGKLSSISIALLMAGAFTLPAAAQDTGATPVVWVNGKNVATSGGTLTEACNGCGDSGAESQQTLTSGDGYFEFVVGSQDIFAVGIGGGGPSTSIDSIEFALRFNGSGSAEVRENGRYITDTRYNAGDRFRIAVEGGAVNYYKYDGSTLRPIHSSRSAAALQYPIKIEAVLLGAQTSVSQAVARAAGTINTSNVTSTQSAQPAEIQWTNLTNASADGNTLVGGSPDQNSGAQSVQTLTGDGFFEFTAAEADKMRAVGLDNYNGSNTFQDIDFAIVLRQATGPGSTAVAEIWENGRYINETSYTAGDRFRIGVDGGIVKYYKYVDNTLTQIQGSDARVENFPLHVDAALYDAQSTIAEATGMRLN